MNTEKVFTESEWIWSNDKYGENEYAEVYDVFYWEEGKVTLNISVRGDYTLFINGEFVESNQYADFEHYKVYDELDITANLKKGENKIAILVWYFGKSGMRYYTKKPGLIYEIVGGDKVLCFSGSETLSRKSKAYKSGEIRKISPQLGYSFIYNANDEDGWINGELRGFCGSCKLSGTRDFYKRPIKKHQRGEIVTGIVTQNDNKYLIDLGKETVGLCSFSIESKTSQKITVSYGELLCDGHVKRKISYRDFSFDYILKPGENTYTNHMLRLAGRYIEIESEDDISINFCGIIPQFYAVKESNVKFSLPLDNEIYAICVNTLKLCMMEHYVDTPWREQCLYAFDSKNQMLFGFYAFEDGNLEYARANFLLMSKDNREDGLMSICFPSGHPLVIPSFSLHYVIAIKEYSEFSGDRTLAEEVFEKMESVLNVFANNMKNGIVCSFEGDDYWNFYDWTKYANLSCKVKGQPDFIINSLFVMALRAFDDICKMISRNNVFKGLAEVVSEKAKNEFYNPETGLFFVSVKEEQPTELANSLAVISGIADKAMAKVICEKLIKEDFVEASLSMKPIKFDALIKVDKERYKEEILNEIREKFKVMIESGSTTVWEVMEGADAFDNAGSLCHGWSASPVYYLNKLQEF